MTAGPGAGPAGPAVAVEGPLSTLSESAERLLLDRGRAAGLEVTRAVATLIEEVRRDGDAALFRQARAFDGVALDGLEVPASACTGALDRLDPELRAALTLARDAIETVHRAQLPVAQELEPRPGVRLLRRPEPLRHVGVYAPGGRAAYPSSVLMGVVPARVAGVGEVVVCSPPGPDGRPPAAVLAACALGGADRVFALGGAGAIAALACGTATVPRVDRIVGPGNAYVTEAKRQLAGVVATDCPAGPSEVLVVADASADARLVAAELLAQAEHDPDAAAVLLSTDASLLAAVRRALAEQLATQPRRAIIEQALAARGGLLLAADLDEALAFAERYAPEHLLLLTEAPRTLIGRVRAAGAVFLGAGSSVAFGDYLTGSNHVLPTAGLARGFSGLSTADFVRWTTIQEVSPAGARALAGPARTLARAEGLAAHAAAAALRGAGDAADREAAPTADATPFAEAPERAPPPPAPRAAYRDIQLYDPARVPCAVDLSDNTNLFGMSPSAAEVVRSAPAALLTRYPSVYASGLRDALARRLGVDAANITTGCGSDDVIDSALRAFCEPGDRVAYPTPTFGVVPLFARMNAALPVPMTSGPAASLDAAALLATGARVTYLCRPNNPTGEACDASAVARIIRSAAGVVLIDEAYADFADDDVLAPALASDRALVLRTLSKAWGLAGLRIGFAVGPEALIREVEKSRGPYKVGALAEAAAVAALERDGAWVRARVAEVRENRARLAEALARLGTPPLPSAANFLLVPLPARLGSALACAGRLRADAVAVRPFGALPRIGEAVRVTIGPWPMMAAFVSAFERLLDRPGAAPTGENAARAAR